MIWRKPHSCLLFLMDTCWDEKSGQLGWCHSWSPALAQGRGKWNKCTIQWINQGGCELLQQSPLDICSGRHLATYNFLWDISINKHMICIDIFLSQWFYILFIYCGILFSVVMPPFVFLFVAFYIKENFFFKIYSESTEEKETFLLIGICG